ncbi:hypothetical protein F2P56_022075 [Juglans regia]|uniref:HTH OST-type domain-containing protein n=1 Tax=Juglans regia TaxID=51240 RepID=A0A833UQ11_JUGRE|nr:hypothetical protein F2P56_022075 [Juglans regia]
MRPPLSPRTLLFFTSYSSPLLVKISHFSSSSHYASYSLHPGRRHDEESRNVRVSVWWDFENCNLPNGVNVFKVAHSITAAVRASGIKGPVTITAFGDVFQLSRVKQEALSSTGINITHIPNGGKNSADRSLLVDLMYWVSQNPPPAHLFLISGDRDFASILHRLRMNNYNILLASPESTPGVLCSAASIMWHWPSLIRGETPTGKHFNQPPDGPYGSWYGHSKVPLEDPFSVTEQPASRAEDLPEPSPDSKPRPVPKIMTKLIRCILNSHPEGISITELRSKLGNTLNIDRDFYGYKKFSVFLLSMPHILKLQSERDGQFVVRGITSKTPEPFQSNPALFPELASNNAVQDFSATSKSNGELGSVAGGVNGKPSLSPSPELNVKGPPKKIQGPSALGRSVTGVMDEKSAVPSSPELNVEEVQQHSPHEEKGVEQVKNHHLPPVVELDSASAVGFLKRVWRKCFGRIDGGPMNKIQSNLEKCSTSGVMSEKKGHETAEYGSTVNGSKMAKAEDKCVNSTSLDAKPICQVPYSSANNGSAIDSKTATVSEAYGNNSSTGPGFFNQMVYWCKFWRSNPNSDILNDQPRDKLEQNLSKNKVEQNLSKNKLEQINSCSEKHSLFSMDSFWSDMESFLGTVNGSVIVSQSRNREQMAQNLRKEGPPALRSLSESDVLHLVDLLISEMKWMEECPSQTSPFKLTRPVGSLVQARGSNGLSSIFLGTTLPTAEHGEIKYQNIPHTGVSPPAVHKKPSVRSRSDILADCQKLVNEILKNYPNGFNMGSFRKTFLERHGYPLDLQKLGHQSLVSLLQIMPGVKIVSTQIFPSSEALSSSGLEIALPDSQESSASPSVANSDSDLSDSTKKNDDFESPWEELGPVADTSSTKNEMESVRSRSDILADCQKLVNEILKNYPNGFNMGSFRKTFLERHGYPLDLQKLGHQSLVSLLQIMPGVKIVSTQIFPSSEASSSSGLEIALPDSQENSASHSESNSDSELSDSTKKNDDFESPWEEFGPVADSSSTKNEMESIRSRSDMLADCQKLVNEILKNYPNGFNMRSFRKTFLERHGYPLDLQKLGHQSLVSLLQIIPGVKIVSTQIFPSSEASSSSGLEIALPDSQENSASHSVANSDSELSDSTKKNDDFDPPWEELGPVADTSSTQNEMESVSRKKTIEQTERQKYPDYEPSISDDDFSDSEGETSLLAGGEKHGKRMNEEDSSLVRILDSWYSTKEGDNRKNELENVDGIVDCSTNGSKPSGSSAIGTGSETCTGNSVRRQRAQKTFSFVADPVEANKDKLIDGILGSLKKSDESRVRG